MKNFWNDSKYSETSLFNRFSRDIETGAAILQFGRGRHGGADHVGYHLIAEADGPVRNAILAVDAGGCALLRQEISGNRYGYTMLGDKWTGSAIAEATTEGFLGGTLRLGPPTTVSKLSLDGGSMSSDWNVSSEWIVQEKIDSRTAWSWDLKESHLIYSPGTDPDHLVAGRTTGWGKHIFMQGGSLEHSGIVVWSVEQGTRTFLRWEGDHTRSAASWATDGKDMAWWYGEGKKPGEESYPKASVMTAPFTTDGAVAQATAKRLRSDVGTASNHPYAVGCGYAARVTYQPPPLNWNLMVVRLADGYSWVLPGTETPELFWQTALGITCEDVFLEVAYNYDIRILRLRLDALGTPVPPD